MEQVGEEVVAVGVGAEVVVEAAMAEQERAAGEAATAEQERAAGEAAVPAQVLAAAGVGHAPAAAVVRVR